MTKPTTRTTASPAAMAVLELERPLLLSPEDAAAVFAILCRGTPVRRAWGSSGEPPYEFCSDSGDPMRIVSLRPQHVATMHLAKD